MLPIKIPGVSDTALDQILLALTSATPPPPAPWPWPTAILEDLPPGFRSLVPRVGEVLLNEKIILPFPDLDPRVTQQLYVWSLDLAKGEPMGLPTKTEPERTTVLKWLRTNTPADTWWTLKRHIPLSDRFENKKRYEYNPVHIALTEAGISYNTAYMTMLRAVALGLAMQGQKLSPHKGYWKWVRTGDGGVTNDREIQHILSLYSRLSDAKQLALFNCLSARPLGSPSITAGDYEFKTHCIEFSPELALRGTLFHQGKKLWDYVFPLVDPNLATSELAQQANAWAAGQGLGTVRPTPSPVLHEPTDDEIEAAAIAKHRAEMAELAAADFDYEDQPAEEDQPDD